MVIRWSASAAPSSAMQTMRGQGWGQAHSARQRKQSGRRIKPASATAGMNPCQFADTHAGIFVVDRFQLLLVHIQGEQRIVEDADCRLAVPLIACSIRILENSQHNMSEQPDRGNSQPNSRTAATAGPRQQPDPQQPDSRTSNSRTAATVGPRQQPNSQQSTVRSPDGIADSHPENSRTIGCTDG